MLHLIPILAGVLVFSIVANQTSTLLPPQRKAHKFATPVSK